MTGKSTQVIAGFIPLLDSAVLIAAAEFGFAEEAGLELKLIRETSWANIRDRISVGHFDVAHMLAPMPIASSLNLTSLSVPMRAPMILGLGGNAITVSTDIGKAMNDVGWTGGIDPANSGKALAQIVKSRANAGQAWLRFGVVHPFSGHAYELRYWLAAAGIDPDQEVDITVLPPPVMPDALAAGQIDGYCVGEPWNTAAVQARTGRIVTCKQAIWPDSPEKVLGTTQAWANKSSETLAALMRALSKAADWCALPENASTLAGLLSGPEFLDCPASNCLPSLSGKLALSKDDSLSMPQFMTFAGGQTAAPRRDHGLWFYSQMLRWGQADFSQADITKVEAVFDDTTYREAIALGPASKAIASTGTTFFDGNSFGPDRLADYIADLKIKAPAS